jgi:hypothetical protein
LTSNPANNGKRIVAELTHLVSLQIRTTTRTAGWFRSFSNKNAFTMTNEETTMALVINGTKTSKVKNLRWLLSHWRDVAGFELFSFPNPSTVNDGYLIATMRDGRIYLTTFACFGIARQWLHRPVFRGLPLNDCGAMTTC